MKSLDFVITSFELVPKLSHWIFYAFLKTHSIVEYLLQGQILKINNGAFFPNCSHNKIKIQENASLPLKKKNLTHLPQLLALSHRNLQLIESLKAPSICSIKFYKTNHHSVPWSTFTPSKSNNNVAWEIAPSPKLAQQHRSIQSQTSNTLNLWTNKNNQIQKI